MLIGYFDSFSVWNQCNFRLKLFFQPEELILDTLYTYIPVEYLPAVGEPDPFIKIPRPDMVSNEQNYDTNIETVKKV